MLSWRRNGNTTVSWCGF